MQGGVVDDNKNRALPQSLFCKLLGDKMGEGVVPGKIHQMMQKQFGNDASNKSLKYLGMAQSFLQSQAAGGGQHAQAAGMLSKILGMCMSATPTQVRMLGKTPPSALRHARSSHGHLFIFLSPHSAWTDLSRSKHDG